MVIPVALHLEWHLGVLGGASQDFVSDLKAMKFGHLEGVPQPYFGDLVIMVIRHLLTGMILHVCSK